MIKAIINGIFNLVIGLVGILLAPIDLVINKALPSLANGFNAITALMTLIGDSVGWGLQSLGLSDVAINMITMYYTFVLTVPLGIWTVKLAIKWYDKIKP